VFLTLQILYASARSVKVPLQRGLNGVYADDGGTYMLQFQLFNQNTWELGVETGRRWKQVLTLCLIINQLPH